jgi:uncharacterized protein (UPF0332 family)
LEDALQDESTITTAAESELSWVEEERSKQMEINEVDDAIRSELLSIHGTPPTRKRDGITRIGGENVNGFKDCLIDNDKVEKTVAIHNDNETDIVLFTEHRLNLRHKDNRHGFRQLFKREAKLETIEANNIHENVGRVQEGGTAILAYDEIAGFLDKKNSGKDGTGLGRWSYMRFAGEDGHATRVVCAYNPCYNNKQGSNTVYQQHRRYFITKERSNTCPLIRFREDLVNQLTQWRDEGDRLIVFMDANQHVYNGPIGKLLTDENGLMMEEAVLKCTGKQTGPTYFRGTRPIDGCWVTSDIEIVNACVMPVGFGVGDHRMFFLDVTTASFVGQCPPKIKRPDVRRLNTKIPSCPERYIAKLESNMDKNRLLHRLHQSHTRDDLTATERSALIEKIDAESKAYMLNAEKKCRRIKCGRIKFSPEASLWIRRTQVYRSLLRFHAGRIRNRSNLKRAACRCGISYPLQLPEEEIRRRLKVCLAKCDYFRENGQRFRSKHLKNRLSLAQEKGDEVAEKRILDIITKEKERKKHRTVKAVTGRQQGRSVMSVQEEHDGEVIEHTEKSAVEHAIFEEIHNKRFTMAESAPICHSPLLEEFGYNSTTPAAQAVLDGTYAITPDLEAATAEIFRECARIRTIIPKDTAPIWVTKADWQETWKKANERTSSSESGLHFSHYKASIKSDYLSHFHATKISIVLVRGIALSRWSRGLSVMLEKEFGVTLVHKLRAILLMEADFNSANKLIYGIRMLQNARRYKLMPEEICSEKGKVVNDGTLSKVLLYDIVRQKRIPAAIASVDASYCFDRVAHAIASLVFQAFGVPSTAVESMLTAIQNMKFFLRTGFGDSQSFAGGTVEVKTQGYMQGNGAAPAGWGVVSIVILNAHKKKGFGAKFLCPISKLTQHLAAVLYVDDTDLIHLDMNSIESANDAHAAIQASVHSGETCSSPLGVR